jgi:hypothetical protein
MWAGQSDPIDLLPELSYITDILGGAGRQDSDEQYAKSCKADDHAQLSPHVATLSSS